VSASKLVRDDSERVFERVRRHREHQERAKESERDRGHEFER
jgi:hypothetical protein